MSTEISSKQVDRFGNVFHTVTRNGQVIGEVRKASCGWTAVAGNGYCTKGSRKAAVDTLALWASLKG